MAGVYVNLAQLLTAKNVSLSRSPFNPDIAIIKRASFPKGEVPPHLRDYAEKLRRVAPMCREVKGTVSYKGKVVPKAAVCVAAQMAEKPETRERASKRWSEVRAGRVTAMVE